MKKWVFQNKAYAIGAVLGGLAGFLYWKYVGCLSGTCALGSKPLNNILYFALMGAVLLGSIQKSTLEKNKSGG